MKAIAPLLFACALTTGALAENYQYQYPSDPYNSAPRPQQTMSTTTSTAPSSSGSAYGFDKLLSYGALEARYNYGDFKGTGGLSNSSGIGASLHAPLFKPLYLGFGVDWLSGSTNSHSYDLTTLSGGIGAYIPLSRVHIFGEVGARYDVSGGLLSSINPDSFSVYFRPGIRIAATEHLELAASLFFASTDNLNNRVYEVNGYYSLLSVLDLGFGVDFSSDVNTYHAGLRLRW